MKRLFAFLLILGLATPVFAQTKLLNTTHALMWGAAGADLGSTFYGKAQSPNIREGGAARIFGGGNVAITGVVIGLTGLADYVSMTKLKDHPKHRIVTYSMAAGEHFLFAFLNYKTAKKVR